MSSLTLADLARKEAAQRDRLQVWLGRAGELIDRQTANAEAHAVKAITDSLKAAPEGRATLRRAARNPSARAAAARLDELWAALVGPSRTSLAGLVRDARESLYRDALRHWAESFPPESLRPPPFDPTRPGASLLGRVRAFPLHGVELRDEVGAKVVDAKRRLGAALAAAGSRSTPGHLETDLVRTWATRTRDGLSLVVRLALSDGLGLADRLAGRDVCRPEMLDDDPTLPA